MTEYISREKAIEAIKRIMTNCNPDDFDLDDKEGYGWWMHSNGENLSVIKAELEIEKVPAADVVEVVLCKDCKHYDNEEDVGWCWLHSQILPGGDWKSFDADDYCSFGERRKEDVAR